MTNTLYIEYSAQDSIDVTLGDLAILSWSTPQNEFNPGLQQVVVNIVSGATVDLTQTFPIFPDKATAFTYYMTAMCAAALAATNANYGTAYYTATNAQPTDDTTSAALASKTDKGGFSVMTATPATTAATIVGSASDTNATNYNLVSGLLGIANGLNSANAAQNSMADIVNAQTTAINLLIGYADTLRSQVNALIAAGQA
jgi:hypothetical protein